VDTAELFLKITNGAERAKGTVWVRELIARDGNDLRFDHAVAAPTKLGNRPDHTEVAMDTARFLIHLVKGRPWDT
jgi:hypothetical protein